MTSERLDSALADTFGTVEIMVHPGLCVSSQVSPGLGVSSPKVFNDVFDISIDRRIEMKQLEYFQNIDLADWSAAYADPCTFGAAVGFAVTATDHVICTNVA